MLAASEWNFGEGAALFRLALTRMIADEAHRQRLQREVRLLIASVIENPVRDGELQDLQVIEDVVNVAPVGVELATADEVVTGYFGSVG